MSNSNVVVDVAVVGYKAFNNDMMCRGYQFEIGKTYTIDGNPILCKRGFHFCTDMQKCFNYYEMDSRICEVVAEDVIEGKDKNVCRTITIVRELSQKEIMDRITDSKTAYRWGLNIGNHEVMIDRVTNSLWAYWWAIDIGNQQIMVDRVTDSEYAYFWGLFIGNHELMIDRVIESEYAYRWAKYIGNADVMLVRITNEYQRKEIEKQIIREKSRA